MLQKLLEDRPILIPLVMPLSRRYGDYIIAAASVLKILTTENDSFSKSIQPAN